MDKIRTFEDLTVWKKSHELALEIYNLTKDFPSEEKFGLVSQMRKAAVSVAANIAEGFKRKGIKDKINFYNISQGSLSELQYYIILVKDLGYKIKIEKLDNLITDIGKMLNGLITVIGGSS
ncbi:MAG: four helix bundle protein [Candidatus Omnitrophica bacterium]|nr:four helix bundle protein [Candidatus Omnitrophota bacterium]